MKRLFTVLFCFYFQTESKLLQRPVKEKGMMTAKVFAEGAEALAPLANEELRSLFFAQAEAQFNTNGKVSVVRLSRILLLCLCVQR